MDGTIGDTLPLCIAAFRNSIQKAAGITVTDKEIIDTFGPSEEGTIRTLIPDHYEEGLKEYQLQYRMLHSALVSEPFEGIRDVFDLIRARGKHLALVTGKARASLDTTLEVFDMLHCFDAIETGSPFGPNKPEGIRSVLKQLHLKPCEAVYIGDNPGDIAAARNVNLPIISAAWDEHADVESLDNLKPDSIMSSIAELKTLLEDWL